LRKIAKPTNKILKIILVIALSYVAYRLIIPQKGLNSAQNHEIQEKDSGDFIDYEEVD